MKKYQIYGFSYICNEDGVNVLNGTKEECENEVNIACFDGLAYFKRQGQYFKVDYPKFNTLTWEHKNAIKQYCGFWVEGGGEYGAVFGRFGQVYPISKEHYNMLCREYPIKRKDRINLPLN